MSYLWHMSGNLTREEVIKDKDIVITETEFDEEKNEIKDTVKLKGDEKPAGVLEYWKNLKDGKYHLIYAGYHKEMAPVLQHLHLKYGEYFKEIDDWAYDFSYKEGEESPLQDEDSEMMDIIYSLGYMWAYGFTMDQDEPVKKMARRKYKADDFARLLKRYTGKFNYSYAPFIFALMKRTRDFNPLIERQYNLLYEKFPKTKDSFFCFSWGYPYKIMEERHAV